MSTHTRKTYQAVAEIIAAERAGHSLPADARRQIRPEEVLANIQYRFQMMFAEDNPRFDAKRFHEACYGDTPVKPHHG